VLRLSARVAGGAVLLSLIVTLLAAPVPARASDLPRFGVQFHAMWSDYRDAQRIAVLDKMAKAGAKWVRIDFGWSSLQPTDPRSHARWYVDRADQVVDAALARGMKVLMGFGRTPEWANGGRGVNVPPSHPSDYGRAAKWVAHHFQGRVRAWGVYNEPNLDCFWTGSARDYAELLRASYSKFKAGDPGAKVVAANVVYNDDRWLGKMYEGGAHGYFDVLATHPYQAVGDLRPEAPDDGTIWRLSHVPAVRNLMCRNGDCDKPIWFTEFGWSSHANRGGEDNWERGVTLRQQADFAVRALEYVGTNFPYVRKMIWYNERNRTDGSNQVNNYGLLYRDLSAKPAYLKLKSFLSS
jgi:polysaccharide biosynthesis protein PslG